MGWDAAFIQQRLADVEHRRTHSRLHREVEVAVAVEAPDGHGDRVTAMLRAC